MKLKAVNAIYRKEKGKQVRVEPGTEFEATGDEADYLIAQKAVLVISEEKSKKAPAKKDAKKAETPAAPAADDVVTPAAVTGADGTADDDPLG